MSSSLDQMLHLMRCLRDPEYGCPWDQRQVFSSIVPHTIEEAYEVADAISRDDMINLKEELGDLLFQIVFYSQLANEKNEFDFVDVVDGLKQKMLRRHPHVFPDGSLNSFGQTPSSSMNEEELKRQWGEIKAKEKALSGKISPFSLLDNVSSGLPPVLQATKIQEKVASVGFDWKDVAPVFDKIREEINELEEAVQEFDQEQMAAEFGDVLFAMINLGRHLELNPDASLNMTNLKFRRRFAFVESCARSQGKGIESYSLDQLNDFWNQAKQQGL
ncbi:nucleoside triphosphate pyrophosphohydrolase [Marinomonas sp. 2405UD68-3]|uniref:nucleoside triphosphate pyrophosphohydrolase n=1 Tax=Marinomonas sp. 2405UD68-3 TaxID=3391835 RepID=UPI0039C9911A